MKNNLIGLGGAPANRVFTRAAAIDLAPFSRLQAKERTNADWCKLRSSPDAPKNFGRPIVAATGKTADIYIYDVIGWPFIEAQDVISAVPAGTTKINVYINSPGGSVFEGLAIYNWIRDHSAAVDVRVSGLAASIASVIACAGRSLAMPAASFLMIHDPWTFMVGSAEDLRKEAELLETIEDVLASIYVGQVEGLDADQVRQWMHEEKWFSGQEAVALGWASSLDEPDESGQSAGFDLSLFAKTPQNVFARAASAPTATHTPNQPDAGPTQPGATEENTMNEQLRKMLEAKGLAKDATDEQALAFLNELLAKEDVDVAAIKAEAAKAEGERQMEIRRNCRIGNLSEAFAEDLIQAGVQIDVAREKIMAEMERTNPPLGAGRFESGATEVEKFRSAAADGLLIRAGVRVEKPAPGAENFRGYELASIVREALARSGVNVSALNSRRAIADYVFRSRHASMTTSDLPSIFWDAINKSLMRAYNEAPATWRPWVNVTTATDFKDIYGIALSEAPDLTAVAEGGEYTYGAMKDNQEKYGLGKYGRMIKVTWEMLINDDLRAFNRYPQQMGAAARRLESEIVYGLLMSGSDNHGPTMTDGEQLFKTTVHNNLLKTGRAITAANVDAGMQLMGAQKGLNGSLLDIQPRYLICGPKNRLAARILFASASNVDDDKSAGVINPMQGELEVIVENRVGAKFSGLGWYLIGDPSQIDTIEVAFLDGYEQPVISEKEEFTSDAITWKVMHCIGAGAMDYRGMVLNDGTA